MSQATTPWQPLDTMGHVTGASDLLLDVLNDVEPLMKAAFDQVGGTPAPGSALDQVFLLNGRDVVEGYLTHGEPGLAFDHLLYMIREPGLVISSGTQRHLLEAACALGLPDSRLEGLA